eukprot:gnl/TRDRNA2_/TRDRNA2_128951_c2_seq1.p2 gnl/TRDRNA2_/TRDRNA2_128951_c2~~gnl/TRDRNA2_/TRDRNA2_128951_c2_seq1.p2  ORF type:complete len:197 (-),score=19.52 gnl/TRDRNA2_/TRDRNA2_128951_c2_seq1:146-670(-)
MAAPPGTGRPQSRGMGPMGGPMGPGGMGGMGGGYPRNAKTELCRYFEANGNCQKGEACTYAHGAHELQGGGKGGGKGKGGPPMGGMGDMSSMMAMMQQMMAAKGMGGGKGGGGNGWGGDDWGKGGGKGKGKPNLGVHTPGYKTQMCRYFESTGSCQKGENCTYAHGAHELGGNR